MPLPINIQDLFTGRVVEWERLEFKEGWNPETIVQSICAFANDFHNWGGGYLVIGVAELDGKPVLPPKGLEPEQVDAIQKKLLELAHKIRPAYHPIAVPATVQDKLILVIWVPGGDLRPYKAPVSLAKDNTEWAYFIRRHANSVEAKGQDEQELIALANKVPFDDRVNQRATASVLQPNLIQSFLTRVKSELAATAGSRPIADVAQDMRLLGGPPEAPFPLNVGLMFFTPKPATWFPCTQIDIVQFPKGAGGGDIIERTFTGPLDVMLQDALAHFKNNLLVEYVRKRPDQAESDRWWNLPYAAFEEVLVNAVYHRSYEEREPIEVRIMPDEILVQSFPGPDRSIPMEELRAGRPVGRRYRNRRIGEFLKELELSEGRNTGIPTIQKAMADNGSPAARFETDENRTYLLVRLPLRPPPAPESDPKVKTLVSQLMTGPKGKDTKVATNVSAPVTDPLTNPVGTKSALSREQWASLSNTLTEVNLVTLMAVVGRTDRTKFRHQVIDPMLAAGLLEMTHPDKPRSRLQKYRITDAGRARLAQTS